MAEPTREDLLNSLASNCCPACGGWSDDGILLCIFCYCALTTLQRELLRRRFTPRYEQVVGEVLRPLGATQFHTEGEPR